MTWRATEWAMAYANHTALAGADAALIIGAVTAPITVLLGYVFKSYNEARKPPEQ